MEEEQQKVIQKEEPKVNQKEEPKVIQNSDSLYKQNVEWVKDIPYTPPTDYEVKMLEGTINPEELLKKESEEQPKELSPEHKRQNNITIVKTVALHRIGLQHFIFHPYKLSSQQKKKYKNMMAMVLDEFNNDEVSRKSIVDEFNEVVCNNFLCSNVDVSKYPIHDIAVKS